MADRKYKLLHEDDKQFLLQHPDGTHFAVAKHAIGALTGNEIRHMPTGGDPADTDSQRGVDSLTTDGKEPLSLGQKLAMSNYSNAPTGVDSDASELVNQPDNIEPTPAVIKAPTTEIKAPASTRTVNSEIADPMSLIRTGFQQQKQSAEANAKAQGELGQQTAAVLDNVAKQNQVVMADFQNWNTEQQQKRAVLEQQYRDNKIDPNRVFHNMNTGNKIMAAIGIALGGAGQGLMGSNSNQAMDVINNAIGRDIDAQKENQNQTGTLLRMNYEQTKDMRDASLMTQNQLLSAAKVQVESAAQRLKGPMAQAAALGLVGQINDQQGQIENNLWMTNLFRKNMAGGNMGGDALYAPQSIEDYRNRKIDLPNGQSGMAKTPEDAKTLKDTLPVLDAMDRGVSEMQNFQKNVGRTGGIDLPLLGETGTNAYHQGMDVKRSLVLQAKQLFDSKRLSPIEFKEIEDIVRDPGAWNQGRASGGVTAIKNIIQNKRNALYQQHLAGYAPGNIQNQEGAPVGRKQ
jgi:hypothetical protein